MIWFKSAWEWIKKHAVLLVGLLGAAASIALGFFLGRKRITVDLNPVPGPSEKQQELDAKTEEEKKRLLEAKNKEQQEIRDKHDTVVDNQVKDLRESAPTLVDNPDELNKHLIDVGKKVRSDG